MDLITKLKELKNLGEQSYNRENVEEVLRLFCNLINDNKNIQEKVREIDVSMILNLKEVGPFFLTIHDSYAECGIGLIDFHDFSITFSVEVLFKLLMGDLDPIEAFFSELFIIRGDFYYLLEFFQVIEDISISQLKAGQKINLVLDSSSLKKLFDIYARGISVLEPIHIPLFFEILTVFTNNNPQAKKLISGEDITIQMNIVNVGKYFIRIVNEKLGWAIGEAPDPNLRFEMGFKTSAEIIFETNPIDAFMKGKLKVEAKENDIFKVLILKDLTDLLVEHLNL
jgi:putative sterol carrier protein